MDADDLVTAQCGLIRAGGFAHQVFDTFSKIKDDCYKVLRDDMRFTWPEIPEDFKIPEHYGYKEPTARKQPEGPPPVSVLAVGKVNSE
jgi:hypothetical protein